MNKVPLMEYTAIATGIIISLGSALLVWVANGFHKTLASIRGTQEKVTILMDNYKHLNGSMSSITEKNLAHQREIEIMVSALKKELDRDIDEKIETALEPIKREMHDTREEMRSSFSNIHEMQSKAMEMLILISRGKKDD